MFGLGLLMPAKGSSQVIFQPNTGLISVYPDGRQLHDLLRDIHARTGLDIYINPHVDKPVFTRIHQKSLEEALKKLIRPLNNIMIFEGTRLAAVKIFKDSQVESTLKLAGYEPAAQYHREVPERRPTGPNHPNADSAESGHREMLLQQLVQKMEAGDLTQDAFYDFLDASEGHMIPPHVFQAAFGAGLISPDEKKTLEKPVPLHTPPPIPRDEEQESDYVIAKAPDEQIEPMEPIMPRAPHFIREDLEGGLITKAEFEAEMATDWSHRVESVPMPADDAEEGELAPAGTEIDAHEENFQPKPAPHLIRQDLEDGIISEETFREKMQKNWGHDPAGHMPPSPEDPPE